MFWFVIKGLTLLTLCHNLTRYQVDTKGTSTLASSTFVACSTKYNWSCSVMYQEHT